jgi:hypothetical protein
MLIMNKFLHHGDLVFDAASKRSAATAILIHAGPKTPSPNGEHPLIPRFQMIRCSYPLSHRPGSPSAAGPYREVSWREVTLGCFCYSFFKTGQAVFIHIFPSTHLAQARSFSDPLFFVVFFFILCKIQPDSPL